MSRAALVLLPDLLGLSGTGLAVALVACGTATIAIRAISRLRAHVRRIDLQLRIQTRSLEAAGTGIVIADARRPDLPIVYVNSAFERLTGYSREEVLGKNCRFLNRLAREQPELEELRRALRAAKPCTVVLRNHAKDGTLFWNELAVSPVLDERGIPTHFIGVQSDITRKLELAGEAETALRSAHADRVRAAEAMRARDVLLATVSHELRSPLNSIRLWASVLHFGELANPLTAARAVAQIEASVETQNRLIEDLLDVSRSVSGKLDLERERVDLGAIALEVANGLRPTAAARGLALEFRPPTRVCEILGDRARLRQVARNLLDNAFKFTPRGGSVLIAVRAEGSEVELEVRDDGAGIAQDQLPRIFEQFWQGAAASPRRHGGLGLGLSIVRHVVEGHGGRISAASDGLGRGATFVARFPALLPGTPDPTGLQGGGSAAAGAAGPGDVLVVEDEPDTAEALALALRLRGLDVRIALDVVSALAAIASRRPRVVISDLGMPELSGFDLIRRVRAEELANGLPRVHAIAISGLGGQADRRRVRRAGFDAFLRKPLSVESIVRTIFDGTAATPR